ncbi:MAG TPA: DUF5683 domain-containing protein [Hanamia sp.]
MATRSLFFIVLFLFTMLSATFAQQGKDTVITQKAISNTNVSNKIDPSIAKNDTIVKPKKSKQKLSAADDSVINKYNPKAATIRSAIFPGWGQFYNKKYWKIPIVWGALGITAGVFVGNLNTYKECKQAVIYRSEGKDSLISPKLQPLSTSSLTYYRNYYRQNIDYSVLVFFLFWGLNIVDATVDAHLKTFDISPDLSMKIRPNLNYLNSPGVSVVFSFREKSKLPCMPMP